MATPPPPPASHRSGNHSNLMLECSIGNDNLSRMQSGGWCVPFGLGMFSADLSCGHNSFVRSFTSFYFKAIAFLGNPWRVDWTKPRQKQKCTTWLDRCTQHFHLFKWIQPANLVIPNANQTVMMMVVYIRQASQQSLSFIRPTDHTRTLWSWPLDGACMHGANLRVKVCCLATPFLVNNQSRLHQFCGWSIFVVVGGGGPSSHTVINVHCTLMGTWPVCDSKRARQTNKVNRFHLEWMVRPRWWHVHRTPVIHCARSLGATLFTP